jgi:hypothetical protein
MALNTFQHGYDPYDDDGDFMTEWYRAATAPKSRIPTQSRVSTEVRNSNYQGLPNEWFYDFAKKNKDSFEGIFERTQRWHPTDCPQIMCD